MNLVSADGAFPLLRNLGTQSTTNPFFTFKLPKEPADRLLCLAVVTRHHHHLGIRTRLVRPGVAMEPLHTPPRARAGIPQRASPLFPAVNLNLKGV
eukprot:355935-Chlamydomonas_euryale.AAC.8